RRFVFPAYCSCSCLLFLPHSAIEKMVWTVEKKIAMGFALTLAILLVVGVVSYRNTRKLIRDSNAAAHSHDVQDELGNTLSTVVEAETGQRGYIITGDEEYLEPYAKA